MSFFFGTTGLEDDAGVGTTSSENAFDFFGSSAKEEEEGKDQDDFFSIFNRHEDDKEERTITGTENPVKISKSDAKSTKDAGQSGVLSMSAKAKTNVTESNKQTVPQQSTQNNGKQGLSQPPLQKLNNFAIHSSLAHPNEQHNEKSGPKAKRPRETVNISDNSSLPVKGSQAHSRLLPMHGEYPHPMQVSNESSPANSSSLQLSLKKQRIASVDDAPTTTTTVQKSTVAQSEKTATKKLMPGTSMNKSSASYISQNNSLKVGMGHSPEAADTEALAAALLLEEYKPLKEQLGNLPVAKQAGNFNTQVALSVEALFSCFERAKSKQLQTLKELHAETQEKIRTEQENFNAQLEKMNTYYQTMVDHKMARLSAILDEVKSNQEDITKYRQLLRSFTADLSSEQ